MHRIKILALTVKDSSYLMDLLSLQSPLTMIEVIAINWHGDTPFAFRLSEDQPGISIFKDARSLCKLSMYSRTGYLPVSFLRQLRIPLGHLVDLDLGSVPLQIHDVHTTLLQCLQLVRCWLTVDVDQEPSSKFYAPNSIVVPRLEELNIYSPSRWGKSLRLFEPLVLPALSVFELLCLWKLETVQFWSIFGVAQHAPCARSECPTRL